MQYNSMYNINIDILLNGATSDSVNICVKL